MLAACIQQAKSIREIELATKLPQATVYRHVGRLSELGLLIVERDALTPDGKRYQLYRARVRSARVVMDAQGVRIYWEPVEEVEERIARVWRLI